MDNIYNTEWLLLLALLVHVIMAPCTKVEESFNVQATHDLLYHNFNISAYDHHDFPGVVPRTFMGPIVLSSILIPIIKALQWWDAPKYWSLFAVRIALGMAVLLCFSNFARCVEKHFGRQTGEFLRLITATQFHFLFYSSRPLPNTFALIGALLVYQLWLDGNWVWAVRVATASAALFRCELVLLFVPIFIVPILRGTLPLLGRKGAIFNGFLALLLTLGITVPIDSLLWRRWLWPEGEVWWFNVVLNRSKEYGVMPYLWYFYSALPRALLASLIAVPAGVIVDRRLIPVVFPILAYIGMYSFLPHKELRFIVYAFPMLNVAAAAFCARLWINRQKSWLRYLIAIGVSAHLIANIIGTSVLLYASSRNYPGGDAIGYLQFMQRYDKNKPISVYVDNFAAQTGVSRFLQLYDAWEYNKSENLDVEGLGRFDFLLIGSYTDKNIVSTATQTFSSTHRLLFPVQAFQRVYMRRSSAFPYIWPVVKLREKMVVLKKLD
uniref:Mannosyltransferase n=2 Tax=Ascaris TaxID=6251 RepID=F1L0F9_ASCSU